MDGQIQGESEDCVMHILHAPEDPLLYETLQYIAQYAMEAPQIGFRMQADSLTLSCTSDALATVPVTFGKPFKSGTTPVILFFVNPSVTSSVFCPSYANPTASGFTAQVYTSSTQSVTINYIAFGQS
jgi:hypothetical protein